MCVWIDGYFSQSNHQCTVESYEIVVGVVINSYYHHDSCKGSIIMTPARALLTSLLMLDHPLLPTQLTSLSMLDHQLLTGQEGFQARMYDSQRTGEERAASSRSRMPRQGTKGTL